MRSYWIWDQSIQQSLTFWIFEGLRPLRCTTLPLTCLVKKSQKVETMQFSLPSPARFHIVSPKKIFKNGYWKTPQAHNRPRNFMPIKYQQGEALANITWSNVWTNIHTKQADTFYIATTYLTFNTRKNPKTIIPTLGELWSASAASCGTRVQRNENPNEKMEKNETICVSAPLSLRHQNGGPLCYEGYWV